MDRFGVFLVWACYVVAALIAAFPFAVMVSDWGDPGHFHRLSNCLPAALVIAVLGKMLDCLLKMAHEKGESYHEE